MTRMKNLFRPFKIKNYKAKYFFHANANKM